MADDFAVYLLDWVNELIDAKEELEAIIAFEKAQRWVNRRWNVHPFNEGRYREQDFHHTAFKELKNYPDKFHDLMRMHPDTFEMLHRVVESEIRPSHQTATAITSEHRLFLTLMFLAHGTDVAMLSLTNRIGRSTAYKVINETCEGIYDALSGDYLKFPDVQTWRNIGHQFGNIWQMPGCLSAIDGKHVHLKAPDNCGSLFFNYKKSFSIVLMAAVNYDYHFTWVDIGQFGGQSDGGILSKSSFGLDLENGSLPIPREYTRLPNINTPVPYYFIGDKAFKLRQDFMKPFHGANLTEPQLIFKYRLSRARRCVESAFGILVMRWRILDKRIGLNPDSASAIVKACVCLHNFLSTLNDTNEEIEHYKLTQADREPDVIDQQDDLTNEVDGSRVGQILTEYFVSPEGQVPWQFDHVRRGYNLDVNE